MKQQKELSLSEIEALKKEAVEFTRNNCMTWCDFNGCQTKECENKDKYLKPNP